MKLAKKLNKLFLKVIDWFLVEPKRLVRLVVLSICSIIVFFQLWECAMKLLHPPISTHSHFDLNHTMHYPAVTFCRQPGFKIDVLEVRERHLIQLNIYWSVCRITIWLFLHQWHRAGRILISVEKLSHSFLKTRLINGTKFSIFMLWMETAATLRWKKRCTFLWGDATRWNRKSKLLYRWDLVLW